MRKHIVMAALASLFSFGATAQDSNHQRDHVAVVGIGEIEAEPDQAILRVSVFAQEPDLPRAKDRADERYSKVLAVLKSHNIDDRHIKATQFSAQPQYDWRNNSRIYKGERVSRALSVTVLDLDALSGLMQDLVENEVSTIDGIETGFQDRSALLQKALALATKDAKNKAAFLAKQLDRDLGSAFLIQEFNEQATPIFHEAPVAYSKASMAADSVPQEMFGTQSIRARVNVSFNLD